MDAQVTTKLVWDPLVYHATTEGLAEGSDIEEITGFGADFEGEPDVIVATEGADTDWGVGYHNGRPCLFSLDEGGYGYYAPEGTVYEQRYGGFAWRVVEQS